MVRGRIFTFLLLCIVVLVSIFSVYHNTNMKSNEIICKDCNVILISIDALRPDHLPCYGYYKNTAPNICKLANESLLFENAFTVVPYTLASLPSIFTSLYPPAHNVILKNATLNDSFITLTEVLKENNYTTIGFTDNPHLSKLYGFPQGFDLYDEKSFLEDHDRYGGIKNINERVYEWLKENKNKKFFLFLHYNDVHCPYTPPEPFFSMYGEDYDGNLNLTGKCGHSHFNKMNLSNSDIKHIIAAYDGGIRYTDVYVGQLLNVSKELNLTQKSIIILTADHGEELMDHGLIGHGHSLYDELIHIPLIIKHPFIESKTIVGQVESIDIMPTILEMLNIKIPEQAQGESLLPPTNRIKSDRITNKTVFSELPSKNKVSIRTKSLKFIYDIDTGEKELYNLTEDPKERNNIANKKANLTKELERQILDHIKSIRNNS